MKFRLWRGIVDYSSIRKGIVIALPFLLSASSGGGQRAASAMIQVKMDAEKPLSLRVILHTTAETRKASFHKSQLPWGIRSSITLVAVTTDGQCLKPALYIDDPSPDRVSLGPDETLSGIIDLQERFLGFDTMSKKSELHVFWAYKTPEELGSPRWSGGWILIPKQE